MNQDDFIPTLNDECNSAIMSETPIIFVEGSDDLQIFEEIAKNCGKECRIKPAEIFIKNRNGCLAVIEVLHKIQQIIQIKNKLKYFTLGIIDGDARFISNDYPQYGNLLVLENYSIESYFTTKEHIEYTIKKITYINDFIQNTIIDRIFDRFIELVMKYYIISLAALRNKIDNNYEVIHKYGDKYSKVKFNNLCEKIEKDYIDLKDYFYRQKNIDIDDQDIIFRIFHGKWLLMIFAEVILDEITHLKTYCKNKEIDQCCYCKIKQYEKCLYRLKANSYQLDMVRIILLEHIVFDNIKYISDRIKKLGIVESD